MTDGSTSSARSRASADWRRQRRTRLLLASAAVPAALSVPSYRAAVVALVAYELVISLLLSRRARQPPSLSAAWWAAVVADTAVIGAFLVATPRVEPGAHLLMLLIVVVQATTYRGAAPISAAILGGGALIAAHVIRGGALVDLSVVDVSAFALVSFLAIAVVGRQAHDLRQAEAALEESNVALRVRDDLRTKLISMLAHDVRGPLAVIHGGVGALRALEGLNEDDRNVLLDGIERQSLRLQRLALELLDLARLETGALTLDLDVVAIAGVVEAAVRAAEGEDRVRVEVPPALCARIDPQRMEEVVVNLLSNALKYGEDPVTVHASCSDGLVTIEVSDAGPGVADDLEARLFEPFGGTEAVGSVGLGLWIARMLVEAHGGTVTYRRLEPAGSCFRVAFPEAGPPQPMT